MIVAYVQKWESIFGIPLLIAEIYCVVMLVARRLCKCCRRHKYSQQMRAAPTLFVMSLSPRFLSVSKKGLVLHEM